MSKNLKIKITNHGSWYQLQGFDNYTYVIGIAFSDFWFDSIRELISALINLYSRPEGSYEVHFFCEPEEIIISFEKKADLIYLEVIIDPFNQFKNKEINYSKIGNIDQICKPFWRALRTCHLDKNSDFYKKYSQNLDLLTDLVKKNR
jgi:hypothetical protein